MSLEDVLSRHFGSSPYTVRTILEKIHLEDDSSRGILERLSQVEVDELQGAGFLSFVYRIYLKMKDGKDEKLIVKVTTEVLRCENGNFTVPDANELRESHRLRRRIGRSSPLADLWSAY